MRIACYSLAIACAALATSGASFAPTAQWGMNFVSNYSHPCDTQWSGGYWCQVLHYLNPQGGQVSYVYGGTKAPGHSNYHPCSKQTSGSSTTISCVADSPINGPAGFNGFPWSGCDEYSSNVWWGYTDGTPNPVPPINWTVSDTFHRSVCTGGMW